jgi:hypothetical protein
VGIAPGLSDVRAVNFDTETHEAPNLRAPRLRRHRLTLDPPYANIGMYRRMKDLTWLADTRSRVKSFPAGVQDDLGYALYAAQLGEKSVKAKALHGLWRIGDGD